jgi:hypothetical protein
MGDLLGGQIGRPSWCSKTIPDDNRKGILAGLDKDGNPMRPVTYRPTVAKPQKPSPQQRNNASVRIKAGTFGGLGLHAAGLHNNLTSAEYRKLGGPPLAPRGQFSRVITNLTTDYEVSADGRIWTAFGVWLDVVSTKGVSFLPFHFNGSGRLPVRNLAGVRPDGMALARRQLIAWAADQIRTYRSGYSRAG